MHVSFLPPYRHRPPKINFVRPPHHQAQEKTILCWPRTVRGRHDGIRKMHRDLVSYGKDSAHLIPQFEGTGIRHFRRSDPHSSSNYLRPQWEMTCRFSVDECRNEDDPHSVYENNEYSKLGVDSISVRSAISHWLPSPVARAESLARIQVSCS